MKNKVVVSLGVIVTTVVLFSVGCSKGGGNSPTSPTLPPTLPVSVIVDSPPTDSTISVGSMISVSASYSTINGFSSLIILLKREDSATYTLICSSNGPGQTSITAGQVLENVDPQGVYAFTKGHTIDLTVLVADGLPATTFGIPCYFWDKNTTDNTAFPPYRVRYDLAVTRQDIPTHWLVQ